jgi:tRNA (mo5U34)-methyltransferase
MQLAERAQALSWYHTLALAPGVETAGMFDLRPYVHRYGLPERMAGLRALDIGTWDGFWAFELERRGAEVVALDLEADSDLDWPPRLRPQEYRTTARGQGFALAKEALGSRVQRVVCNVYDARPEDLGTFDLVFCGSVLTHVRDQLLALERIAALCHGRLILAEEYDRAAGLLPVPLARYRADRPRSMVFWLPSARTWRRMVFTAGFDRVREHCRFTLRARAGFGVRHVVLHADRDSGPFSAGGR